ncbi:Pls/PosA family non-ribosomal peptide synthetase [Streptomyces sp. NPDC054841]
MLGKTIEATPAAPAALAAPAAPAALATPAAAGTHAVTDGGHEGAVAHTAGLLAEVLAGVVRAEQVPLDSHFFHDLGADSLVMAQFCARVRKRDDLPTVSMKDIYRHSTIQSLATALVSAAPIPAQPSAPSPDQSPAPSPDQVPDQSPVQSPAGTAAKAQAPAGTRQYVLCAVLQLLLFFGYSCLTALIAARGYEWVLAGSGLAGLYLRAVLFGGAGFVALCAFPVVAKWLLIGRFTPRQIPVWSLGYLRFWLVKTLIRTSPIRLFTGSPLYVLYLRALGANIGRGVAIFSKHVPVCTDLLTIGDGTVIRKDSFVACYRAHAGLIQMGPVTLGRDVTVSEQTVLDIESSMGDGAQLGHASALHAGQAVPAGERWHGSPAQRTDTDFRAVAPAGCTTLRKVLYCLWQVLSLLMVQLPVALVGVGVLVRAMPQLGELVGAAPLALTSGAFYRDALAASFVLFFGALLTGLLVVATVPRLLHLAIKPGTVYPLYGFHHFVQRTVAAMTNRRFFTTLFGDSSAIVHYLRYLGYDLCRVEQTGSNFGALLKHDTPYLSTIGSKTVVADGLSLINADFSATSFRLSKVSVGGGNFLGNNIAYPSQGRTGEDCLLATKVMVPIDGPVREGVGLLGSPSFEIPRTVERDNKFNHLESGSELRRRLAAKNRHNALTAVLYLLMRWIHLFAVTLIAMAAVDLYHALGALVFGLASVLTLAFTACYFALIERAVTRFRDMEPLYCSIYEPSFWRHERFWKMASVAFVHAFDGTPFKNLVWRLLGARIGKRVFDDGLSLVERTPVTIGDDCTFNVGSVVQCHSQEDGAFKSDRTTIGAGVTLGVGAFVHYGVTIGDGVQLACDSFLMKGEEVPPNARWGGNPAREIRDNKAHLTARHAGNDHDTAAPARGN